MSQLEDFKGIIKRLRAKDGCPWDREQTHSSLKGDILEEAAEVICGINLYEETGNPESMKEELGDLLMLILMECEIASEEGLFDLEDVAKGVKEKMIHRHPHVFGDVKADTTEEVLKNWAEIKKTEKSGKEWMDDKIPEAFDECVMLLKKAKEKKLKKLAMKKENME